MDKTKLYFTIFATLFILRAIIYYMEDLKIENEKEVALKIAYNDEKVLNFGLDKFSQVEVYALNKNLMPTDEESSTYGVKFCENEKGCYLAVVDLTEEKVEKVYRLAGVEIE